MLLPLCTPFFSWASASNFPLQPRLFGMRFVVWVMMWFKRPVHLVAASSLKPPAPRRSTTLYACVTQPTATLLKPVSCTRPPNYTFCEAQRYSAIQVIENFFKALLYVDRPPTLGVQMVHCAHTSVASALYETPISLRCLGWGSVEIE